MTLRAEDFNLKATGSQNMAEEYVEMMNQALEEKNYTLYKQGFQRLMNEVGRDMTQLKKPMDFKLFSLDMVARFINEVQEIEFGLEKKLFSTRIGIGTLFLNPTLEVISTITGEVLATFENVDCFKLTRFSRVKLKSIQDKRIKNQDQRLFLMERIERAKLLIDNPEKIFLSKYNGFLVDPPKNQKGFLKKAYASILRFQHLEYYMTTAGEQRLRGEMSSMQHELAEVQANLDAYPLELLELDRSKREFVSVQSPFHDLMQQYKLLLSNIYYEELEKTQKASR